MGKFKDVGRSPGRTAFKHFILNSEIGRLIGVFSRAADKVPAKANPFIIVDLCAGDGNSVDGNSSPEIIQKHIKYGRKYGVFCEGILIEKNEHTASLLSENADHELVNVLCADASDFVIGGSNTNQAVFIHADPNHIAEMPISDEMLLSWPRYTTFLITLGCNVGGLKRLSIEERREWFTLVDRIERCLSKWHDILLVSLNNDSSQWAYLVRLPSAWEKRTTVEILRNGKKLWKHGVSVVSLRREEDAYRKEIDRLFLTKKELAQ